MAFVEMLGSKLATKGGETVDTVEALQGMRAVALYFSAHWCPPCRGFTPKFAEWYTSNLKSKGLEVVFVSSDRDEEAFKEYFAEQPWLALPYSERELKNKLSSKFKVRGIPSVVILDGETGETISLDGRGAISKDPKGENFPWIPPTLTEVLMPKDENKAKFLLSKEDDKKTVKKDLMSVDEMLKSNPDLEAVGIYFSAHWCPPCRGFTPKLIETYNAINAEKKRLEIIFCSADQSTEQFNDYYGEMPWLSLDFEDGESKINDALSDHFEVSGIPAFVVLDAKNLSGEPINKNAVGKVRNIEKDDSTFGNFPWAKQPVREIDEDPEGIDEGLAFILLQENVSDASKKETQMKAVEEVAKKFKDTSSDLNKITKDTPVHFFCASKTGRLADRVRSECAMSGDESKDKTVVMMNIPEESYYEFPYETVTVENVEKFFQSYKDKALTAKTMGA